MEYAETGSAPHQAIRPEACHFSSPAYSPHPLTSSNFFTITANMSRNRIAFVDGGEACLISSPDCSKHMIRACGIVMQKKATVQTLKDECRIEIKAQGSESGVTYVSRPLTDGCPIPVLSVDSFDERLRDGTDRAAIHRLSSLARRIAELKIAERLISSLEPGDILVLDGTMETRFTEEREALEELFAAAEQKEVLVSALAKSCTWLTSSGRSMLSELARLAPAGAWYYFPVVDISSSMHKAAVYFTKLHPRSSFIFRFEHYSGQKRIVDRERLFSFLASVSNDLTVPGYPYGLIKADRLARVSERERHYLTAKLMASLAPEQQSGRSLHEILDSIS